MAEIRDGSALREWLDGRPAEFACVLAARAALRAVPVLEVALHEDGEARRRCVVLPWFRVLAASGLAGARPGRAREVCKAGRSAAQDVVATFGDLVDCAWMNVNQAREFGLMEESPEEAWRYENEAGVLSVAQRAVVAAVEATRSVVAFVDAAERIVSPAAVREAAVLAMEAAQDAIDGIHGDTKLRGIAGENERENDVAPHVEEFWNAVERDVECLEAGESVGEQPETTVAGLSEEALWINRTPVWTSRHWADFRDALPETEGWQVWIDWYQARLAGRELDDVLEARILSMSADEWSQAPAHVNRTIKELIESRSDPVVAAMVRGFEELEAVRDVSSIDLTSHMERMRNSLPGDPRQAIGATKEMLETTMKTILDRRGHEETDRLKFPDLTDRCLQELGVKGRTAPATDAESYQARIASSAQKMIEAANELRNQAGTGHGRVAGKEPDVSTADANLVASVGCILAAWLLRHDAEG